MSIPAGVMFDDPELWLCAHIRSRIGFAATVTNRWPEPLPAGLVVIVRYDGGPQVSYVTEESAYGFTILGSAADSAGAAAMAAAREVRYIVSTCWGVAGPFANCIRTTGPIRVPNVSRPERYFTAELVSVGSAPNP